MSKIVVYSMAYAGDVHPYVPVATELANRGHDVTFVVPREFHPAFANEPFTCVHSGSDFSPSALNEHGEWLAKWGMRLGGARLLELYIGEFTVNHLQAQYDAIHAALDGADVLFCHSTAAIVGSMAADARAIPWISGDLFPMLIPTATATPFANVPSLGSLANRAMWKLARSPYPSRLTFAGDFADFRRKLGIDSTPRSIIDMRISPHLNLGMASPHYIPIAPDWPDNYEMVGFTHWENEHSIVPEELTEFLGADEPALLITLGTLAAATHPERFIASIEAASDLGIRTVSLCSLDSTATAIRKRFDARQHRAWPFAPLAKVLPHVLGVVHSGSHGTNSMALAAGLPSAIIPSIFDQTWHARRQQELGTGVYARKTKHLPEAIAQVVQDNSLKTTAAELCALLASENGTATSADRIERFLA